jgi:hypothetical protein
VNDVFPWIVDGIHVLPVLHERVEFADCVRDAVARLLPDAVAVEVPSSLERRWLAAVDRLPAISVLLYENAAGQTIYLPVQPADPFVEAARYAREQGLAVRCADLDVDGYADYRDAVPDAYALLSLGLPRLYEAFRAVPRVADRSDAAREAAMAHHAQQLRAAGAQSVLLVCGMHHAASVAHLLSFPQGIPLTPPVRRNVRLVHLHPESLSEVLAEAPIHVAVYEARRLRLPDPPPEPADLVAERTHGPFRVLVGGGRRAPDVRSFIARAAREAGHQGAQRLEPDAPPAPLDRRRVQHLVAREAEQATQSAGERVEPWQRQVFARYTHKLARTSGALVADLFDWLAAARASVSDNYAWELHRLATAYPAQPDAVADLPTARIRAEEMWDGVRRLRLQRRLHRPKRPDWRTLLGRRRRSERWPGEWLAGFDGQSICSWPPEDIRVEDFGHYLRKRGKSILSGDNSRTVPFTTSLLDGIDVRETIRNWHAGQIMVRELGRAPGDAGSVVLILEDEGLTGEQRYPYLQTWHGEHAQESDMAFYCSDPLTTVVGPGICRASYGGFLLSCPPRRMADVWSDPDYSSAESKAEVLLLAALDYCVERIVVYVAPKPPRSILAQLARRLGLKLLYLPLGSLSPTTLARVRVMHILSGQDKRAIASDYVD